MITLLENSHIFTSINEFQIDWRSTKMIERKWSRKFEQTEGNEQKFFKLLIFFINSGTNNFLLEQSATFRYVNILFGYDHPAKAYLMQHIERVHLKGIGPMPSGVYFVYLWRRNIFINHNPGYWLSVILIYILGPTYPPNFVQFALKLNWYRNYAKCFSYKYLYISIRVFHFKKWYRKCSELHLSLDLEVNLYTL